MSNSNKSASNVDFSKLDEICQQNEKKFNIKFKKEVIEYQRKHIFDEFQQAGLDGKNCIMLLKSDFNIDDSITKELLCLGYKFYYPKDFITIIVRPVDPNVHDTLAKKRKYCDD